MIRLTKYRVFALVAVFVIALPAAGYLLAGKEARGMVSYLAWRAFNADAGTGDRAEVNGIRLYYEKHGSGEPLLLMHGGSAFIESFYGQIPALAREYRIIAPDSRGHGRSTDGDGPLSYALMASDMLALVEKLKLGSVNIVGWSDGGIIGLDLAINHPSKVKKLVMIGSNFRTDGMSAESIAKLKTLAPDDPFLDDARRFYRRIAPDPDKWPVLIGKVKAMWLTQPDYTAADLAKVRAKTLVILGENDDIRREHGQEMARLIPGARLVIIPGTSHMAPMEKPDEVNRLVLNFLREK
ncbi:MAG TPA: alpha/beta hydrolase [Spirochaetota bacterium]|nr:alpha/beta hydrolase [Spirochaetota bacterium]HOD15125.1 alpha/beta hydrolase [Spirochaetota bacterium]HPG51851.1 alpha/beta hydrolase [Spirochaetota bacterium]HPN13004.1 alpha/beta hydrolase [Spirochaetota bacterium]